MSEHKKSAANVRKHRLHLCLCGATAPTQLQPHSILKFSTDTPTIKIALTSNSSSPTLNTYAHPHRSHGTTSPPTSPPSRCTALHSATKKSVPLSPSPLTSQRPLNANIPNNSHQRFEDQLALEVHRPTTAHKKAPKQCSEALCVRDRNRTAETLGSVHDSPALVQRPNQQSKIEGRVICLQLYE